MNPSLDIIFRHVTRVAKYIKQKRPGIKLFIWHDMLSQLVSSGYHNVSFSNENQRTTSLNRSLN